MAKKRIDPKAKQKRQKIIAVGGAVLLVGVLAIQVPRTMKMLNPPAPAAPAPAATEPTPAPSAGDAVVPGGEAVLADAPVNPDPQEGQLVSFELFKSKDPFIQQVKELGPEGESGDIPATPTPLPPDVAAPGLPPDVAVPDTPAVPGSDSDPVSGSGSGSGSSSGSGSTSTGSTGTFSSATISINGVDEVVTIGKEFPSDDPLFTLVSLSATSAEIAIAGGSYQDGAPTVTLVKGKTLTLMNTTDGARYEIRLIELGSAAESSSTTP